MRIILKEIRILMVRIFVLILLVSVLAGCADYNSIYDRLRHYNNSFITEQVKPDLPAMNAGSAKTLVETCVVVSIFLEDPESSFSNEKKTEILTWLQEACEYLEDWAKKYNQPLKMIHGTDDLIFDCKTNKKFQTDGSYDKQEYNELEKLEAKKLYIDIKAKYAADNIVYLIFVNKDGCSYANSAYKDDVEIYYFDNAVIYSSYEGELSDTPVIAHEMLHLFGAEDLYFDGNPKDERIQLAEKYFPDDIMNVLYMEIKYNVIGDLDAYLIGWKDSMDIREAYFLLYIYYSDSEVEQY